MSLNKSNQTPRQYLELSGFEIRIGKFVDPNEHFNGSKMEIRITKLINDENDTALFESLKNKIMEWLQT